MHYYFSTFTHALWWNTALYGLYKACSFGFALLLYNKVPTEVFSVWATCTSTLYLLLLWADFGLRKALARYALIIHHYKQHNVWYMIGIVQCCVYMCITPLICFMVQFLAPATYYYQFLWVLLPFFWIKGITELIKAYYHGLFDNKLFNTWNMQALFLEFLLQIILLYTGCFSGYTLLLAFFYISVCIYVCLCIYTFKQLPKLLSCLTQSSIATTSLKIPFFSYTAFIKHALTLWCITLCKSFSDRNFLVLFVTFVSGTQQGNAFKIMYDAALFLYQIGVRIIGSTDTVLLTIAHMHNCEMTLNKTVFFIRKLCSKLFAFLLIITILYQYTYVTQSCTVTTMLIFCIGFLQILYMVFSPYERFFEVQQRYNILFIPTFFYMSGFLVILYSYKISLCSFSFFIINIHVLRLLLPLYAFYTYQRLK